MNKLTYISLALLCLFLSSCAESETDSLIENDLRIESRTTDNISVKFLTTAGQDLTISCTHAEVSYNQGVAELLLESDDNTVYTGSVYNLDLSVAEGHELQVTADQNSFTVFDLEIEVCSTELCYTNPSGSIVGTALEFIVEDDTNAL